jgi:hypothetical protein
MEKLGTNLMLTTFNIAANVTAAWRSAKPPTLTNIHNSLMHYAKPPVVCSCLLLFFICVFVKQRS